MKPSITVLCGAISPEREVSLVSGEFVYKALKNNFDTTIISLDKNELPKNLDANKTIIYPVLHGDYGEDGTLQKELEDKGFTYVGSDSISSRVCMIKPATKALLKFANLPVAKSLEFNAKNKPSAETIFELFPNGSIIKPADKGSSVGLIVAKNIDDTKKELEKISQGEWMAEEFCNGREFSIGVIDSQPAGVVEIIPDGGVYDFARKYTTGATKYEFPANIEKSTQIAMQQAAQKAFEICGCRDFARVDFILTDEKKNEFIILEINTLPGMTPTSLLPKSASCIGYNFETLCSKLIENAIARFANKNG